MNNIPRQVHQHPIMNTNINQEDLTQKDNSLWKLSPNRWTTIQLEVKISHRKTWPRKNNHYEKCPPAGTSTHNYESKYQTGGLDLERRLIMKIVAQQVDQHQIRKSNIWQEGFTQKEDSLFFSWLLVHLLGDNFHNEFYVWVKASCSIFEFVVGCWSTCWGTVFIMSLLSGSSLPVWYLSF